METSELKKLLFVFNPHSGMGQIKNKLMTIIDTFTKAGYDVTAYPTQYRADAYRKVRDEGGNYDLIVCSGGDGTLDEAVSGIYKSDLNIPLGYIPAGSTNDFANSLKIPKKMETAADIAVNGSPFLCDIGRMNDKTFVYVAAFGMFTDVTYQTDQGLKNMLGHMAYILEGAKRLNQIPAYKVKVTANGEEMEEELIFGMVSNSKSVGGITTLTGKNTLLDDGLFEVLLIRTPRTPVALNETLACLLAQAPDNRHVYSFKASEVRFEFMTNEKTEKYSFHVYDEQPPWTIDGEFGGTYKSVTIKNIKQAVSIMRKKEENSLGGKKYVGISKRDA